MPFCIRLRGTDGRQGRERRGKEKEEKVGGGTRRGGQGRRKKRKERERVREEGRYEKNGKPMCVLS